MLGLTTEDIARRLGAPHYTTEEGHECVEAVHEALVGLVNDGIVAKTSKMVCVTEDGKDIARRVSAWKLAIE